MAREALPRSTKVTFHQFRPRRKPPGLGKLDWGITPPHVWSRIWKPRGQTQQQVRCQDSVTFGKAEIVDYQAMKAALISLLEVEFFLV
jgi:hypothetical protein